MHVVLREAWVMKWGGRHQEGGWWWWKGERSWVGSEKNGRGTVGDGYVLADSARSGTGPGTRPLTTATEQLTTARRE